MRRNPYARKQAEKERERERETEIEVTVPLLVCAGGRDVIMALPDQDKWRKKLKSNDSFF